MEMFCFQCEQTANGSGCTRGGVCGKKVDTALLQDKLTSRLVELSCAAEGKPHDAETDNFIVDSLFTTITNVNFDDTDIEALCSRGDVLIRKYGGSCLFSAEDVWHADEDVRSLESLLLFGMRGMAAYAHHARVLGKEDPDVNAFFYKGLASLAKDLAMDERLALVMECGQVNLKCMALLNDANVGAYGKPEPTPVSTDIEAGPFIIVTGHDLRDLKLLLEQTEGKGVNIYTHGEMLPAHAYPELKRYAHLKGNFGTAWQNQKKGIRGRARTHPVYYKLPDAADAFLFRPRIHDLCGRLSRHGAYRWKKRFHACNRKSACARRLCGKTRDERLKRRACADTRFRRRHRAFHCGSGNRRGQNWKKSSISSSWAAATARSPAGIITPISSNRHRKIL